VGAVTFGVPLDLAAALIRAGNLQCAVETGTYRGDSALALRTLVPRVWSVEVLPELHKQAVANVAGRDGVHLLLGYSPEVLTKLAEEVDAAALFWLDAHGGTFGGDDLPTGYAQCPTMGEIDAISYYRHAADACILIDDARAFFGPMLQHNPDEWPTFLEVADKLRSDADRYVTVLDDVIIAVPSRLRSIVDDWWRDKLDSREGLEALQQRVLHAENPRPLVAFKRFARAIAPAPIRDGWTKWRIGRSNDRPDRV
jgi:hypothetical protein